MPTLSGHLSQHPDSENPNLKTSENELIEALRCWDELAFAELVDRYHVALIRLARAFVSSHVVAEEVVQETWLAVLEGITRFKKRSSIKTWIFKILTNRAKTRGQRESRYVSFSKIEEVASEEKRDIKQKQDHCFKQ